MVATALLRIDLACMNTLEHTHGHGDFILCWRYPVSFGGWTSIEDRLDRLGVLNISACILWGITYMIDPGRVWILGMGFGAKFRVI